MREEEIIIFEGKRKHKMRCPKCGRAAPSNFCMVHGDVEALDLETSEKAQQLTRELLKAQKAYDQKFFK